MVSLSEVIAFLWNLMHDDEARSNFEQDPQGALDDCGLSGVSARDIQDAQMVMQNSGLAHPREGSSGSGGHSSPIDEIRHTSTTYEIDRSMTIDNNQVFTVVDIDETTTVNDSFNSGDTTNDVTAIQDNDTTTSNTAVDVTDIEDSFNDDAPEQDTADEPDQSAVDTSGAATDPDADTTADPDAEDDTALPTDDEDGAFHTLPAPAPAPDPEPVAPDAEDGVYADEELDAAVG
jgi:hypothetical protein